MELLDDLFLDDPDPDAEALILGLLRVADKMRDYGAEGLVDRSHKNKSPVNSLSAANILIVLKRIEDYDEEYPEDVDPRQEGFLAGEVAPAGLAKNLVRTPASISQLLSRLHPDYIKHRPISGRKKALSLTRKGRNKARSLEAKYSEMVSSICSDLSATSIQQSFKALEKLYLALKAEEEKKNGC